MALYTTISLNNKNNSSEEIDSLKRENSRLKKQLKDLREIIANFEKTFPEPKNDLPEVNIHTENIDDKISDVVSRTLCNVDVAKKYLIKCNYDVEKTIMTINWSNLNGVPTVPQSVL